MSRTTDAIAELVLIAALGAGGCGELPTSGAAASGEASEPEAIRISLIGEASVPAAATDRSGLTDALEDGTPHNLLGSFGSAIVSIGGGSRLVALSDRGPADGAVSYFCRLHEFDLTVAPDSETPATVRLVSTTMLHDQAGRNFVGLASAFGDAEGEHKRFDPEGICVSPKGTFFISDEYGPSIHEFTRDGRLIRSLPIPAAYLIDQPDPNKDRETALNRRGRVTNRGFEGLTISPEGTKLYALPQGPLIQDGGTNGVNVRLLELDLSTGLARQLVLPMDRRKLGFNEILALSERAFLVIERDGDAGTAATHKKIVRVDVTGATDVSNLEKLPATDLPATVVPARKETFVDLLEPRLGLTGDHFPEKVEGLAWGPTLQDGREVLLVATDNDFKPHSPTLIWAFEVEGLDVSRSGVGRPVEASRLPALTRLVGE